MGYFFSPSASASEADGEQRYLILECKVRVFEDANHQDNQFAHDGSEGDFGGFTGGTQPPVKLFELTIGMGGDEGGHVEGTANGCASAADATPSVPLAAFARMRCQSGQGCRLPAVERAQFGQFGEHAQGGDGPDAGNGFEFLHALVQGGSLCAQRLELFFNLFHVPFEPPHEALGLAAQGGHGEAFGLLALGDEDLQDLDPAADQFGQSLLLFVRDVVGLGCNAWP